MAVALCIDLLACLYLCRVLWHLDFLNLNFLKNALDENLKNWSICYFTLQMSFLESVLLKNGFYFICILDFLFIRFLFGPFHFALFLGNTLSFVSLAKPMGQVGRDFTFQSYFSF